LKKRAYAPVALFIIFLTGIFGMYFLLENGIIGTTKVSSVELIERVKDPVKVHFIDVGMGDSIFIEVKDVNILIDAGPKENAMRVVAYLKSFGVEKLDFIFLSHIHEDHMGGMAEVIRNFDVGKFYASDKEIATRSYESMISALAEKGVPVTEAKAGVTLTFDENITLSLLSPNSLEYINPNNYSPVTKLSYGQTAFLFTGDAENTVEQEVVRRGLNIKADVFKAAHHGSTTSNTRSFLERVDPDYVVVTSEDGNDFNLPDETIMSLFSELGSKVLMTEELGSITFSSDGREVRLLNH